MDFTEFGMLVSGFLALGLYTICMFDFPLRRARHLTENFTGIARLIYMMYGLFFAAAAIWFGITLTRFAGMYASAFGGAAALAAGTFVFLFFAAATLSVVDRRSTSEAALLELNK
ncbi:hypothetical protein [Alkalicoccus urumqiensis]|uniref:Uncharacterized protein n=1 Tax=Alkalicoccus urumqiensis TaxID=1548213 RepID=A0A2P6MK30_ALKUR|nr:hypothetical protein [Alkalicoccus urumqiensis]PRO66637.1 hypothetical protein C6I21_04655 [Alkalicoccus urumqiensis]